jgi:hypothetical protein
MATESELMLHEFSFPPTTRQTPVLYSHNASSSSQYKYTPQPQSEPSTDLNLLAHQFSQHSIRYEPRNTPPAYSTNTSLQYQTTSPSTNYAYSSSQNSYDCPHRISTSSSRSIRSQGQTNIRPQFPPSNTREISSRVERMIASGEQCLVCSPEDYSSNPISDEPNEMDELEFPRSRSAQTLSYRRSSDFTNQNYVTKKIRVRKERRQKSDPSRWRGQ